MLTISRKCDYGLLLMTALADQYSSNSDQYLSLKEITHQKKMPYRFVTQIASNLKAAGLLESKEGIDGGYRLARSPQKILVGEILAILAGPVAPTPCFRQGQCHCQDVCSHQQMIKQVATLVQQAFDNYSLQDLLD